jgi:hypothetical protein
MKNVTVGRRKRKRVKVEGMQCSLRLGVHSSHQQYKKEKRLEGENSSKLRNQFIVRP